MFKKIFLPVDGTSTCEPAIKMAKDLAIKYDSEIVIFNAQDIVPAVYWVNDPVMVRTVPYDPKVYADEIVQNVKTYFDDTGIKISTVTEVGDAATEIIYVSEREECDLIIMCTHGMTATKRFLLGSVTNKVVHHASIPILVVR